MFEASSPLEVGRPFFQESYASLIGILIVMDASNIHMSSSSTTITRHGHDFASPTSDPPLHMTDPSKGTSMAPAIAAPALPQRPPRSPRVKLGGLVLLPRMLDKGRATLVGKNGDYYYDCPMDKRLLAFIGIEDGTENA